MRGLAAGEQQRSELAREHLLALQENQFLRLRLGNIPACTAWGYLAVPNMSTNPGGQVVLVSDRSGSVFRSEGIACGSGAAIPPAPPVRRIGAARRGGGQ